MGLEAALNLILRKNSAGAELIRRRLNLTEGSNVTLTVSDDPANDEVDVTIDAAGGGGGAPANADYLVGTAQGGLSAEIVVGTSPGGELGGTWAAPTVDATHSGSAHHAQSHGHTGGDGSGTVSHANLTGVSSDQHHVQTHAHNDPGDGTGLVPESLEITGGPFATRGDISPTQITSNQNDYNPTGLADAVVLRLDSDAARDITGLQGGADGRIFVIHNVGSGTITLKDASASSSAANRFALAADIVLAIDDAAILQYDSTSSRWRCVGSSINTGGGGGSGYSTVEDDGTALTQRTTLDFVGRGVITDDMSSETRIRVEDPRTMSFLKDEFYGNDGLTPTAGLGWQGAGGTFSGQDAEAGHPGIMRRDTSTGSGTLAYMMLGDAGDAQVVPTDSFDTMLIARLNVNDSNTRVRFGLSVDPSADAPADGIYFEKADADTNWFAVTRASSSETRTDTGVAVSTNWARFRIRRKDGSTIGFTIDANAEDDVTATIPTAALQPFFHIRNNNAASKTIDIDYFDLLITGLSR